MGCQPPIPQQLPSNNVTEAAPITPDTNAIILEEPPIQQTSDITQLAEARFFQDSIAVSGEGYSLDKRIAYKSVTIYFDDDSKVIRTEVNQDIPFKLIDKNTIYLYRGATLSRVSRYYQVPIQRLLDCNSQIKNPNKLPAMSRLKLNCND